MQPDKIQKLNTYAINFCNTEDAIKGAKAINHLIKLNGGKESLF